MQTAIPFKHVRSPRTIDEKLYKKKTKQNKLKDAIAEIRMIFQSSARIPLYTERSFGNYCRRKGKSENFYLIYKGFV